MKVTEGGMVSGSLQDIEAPRIFYARQTFLREIIPREEAAGVVGQQLSQERFASLIKPGVRIAVAAGSRGTQDVDIIMEAIVDFIKSRGAVPLIVPAMEGHGGATAEGQLEVLASYDITSETTGCPIRSSMEVMELGVSERGRWMFTDRSTYEVDGIIISCRLRPHNAFCGTYESGPCKMMTAGLDKQEGASIVHSNGMDVIAENIPTMTRAVLEKAKILLVIPCMENTYDETYRVETVLVQNIMEREPGLLEYALSNIPKLMVGKAGVLVVDGIGKGHNGMGVDPNIAGTFSTPYATGGTRMQRTCFLNLSQASHGNALNCGLIFVITKKIFDRMDIEKMCPNCITSTVLVSARIPCMVTTDREALQLCIHTYNKIDRGRVRVVRIANSLHIGEIMLSEAHYEDAKRGLYPGVGALDRPEVPKFDESGNLTTLAEYMTTP